MKRRLDRLEPGSGRTFLSAAVGNEAIDALNALLMLRGVGHLEVSAADAGYTVQLRPEARDALDQLIDGGLPGGGSLSFRGEWAIAEDYEAGDVVIRSGVSTIDSALAAGTYIAAQSHTSAEANQPPTGNETSNAYWLTLARARWEHFWSYDNASPTTQARGFTHINGGDLSINFGARSQDALGNPAELRLDASVFDACPASLKGRVFKPVLVKICHDGVEKHTYVLACEPFVLSE